MRDYDELVKALRCCVELQCEICPRGDTPFSYIECKRKLSDDAADAIEELAKQIAEAGKMLDELISYAQNNADESREAEKRYYGDDFTVSRYTWMHNQKCTHERYVEKLERIAMMLPGPPKEDDV